jgi:hypothetical protein
MAAAGEHGDRQRLRPRPGEDVGERDYVVLLAVDDDRVGGNGRRAESLHGRRHQHEALGGDVGGKTRLHERAERESCEHDGERSVGSEALLRVGKRRARVVGLARAVVKAAFGAADTAEVEADADVAQRKERLRERLRDLVVERSALLRMRVRDQRDAARRSGPGRVDDDFERTCGAVDDEPLG